METSDIQRPNKTIIIYHDEKGHYSGALVFDYDMKKVPLSEWTIEHQLLEARLGNE
jgi:hypothetical protein